MFNLIQRFFQKDNFNRRQTRTHFQEYFFSLPEHQWLCEPQARQNFEEVFSCLPIGLLDTMLKKHPVVFMQSERLNDKNVVSRPLMNSIYIFPEFQKLILSDRRSAVAYIAHELALVMYELEEIKADPLMAEVEADKFVCDIGLTFELEELLLMLDETIEKRLRLTYLTINHFTQENL
jgi:hypothetical protein